MDEHQVWQWNNSDPDSFVAQWMLCYPQSTCAQLPVVWVKNSNVSLIDLWSNRLIYHLHPEGISLDGAYESIRRQLFIRTLSEVLATPGGYSNIITCDHLVVAPSLSYHQFDGNSANFTTADTAMFLASIAFTPAMADEAQPFFQ